jgi:hypothetical protein
LRGEALGDARFHAFGRCGGAQGFEGAGYLTVDGVGLAGHWVSPIVDVSGFQP